MTSNNVTVMYHKRNYIRGKEAKIFNWMRKGIRYLISKTRAGSTLGRGGEIM